MLKHIPSSLFHLCSYTVSREDKNDYLLSQIPVKGDFNISYPPASISSTDDHIWCLPLSGFWHAPSRRTTAVTSRLKKARRKPYEEWRLCVYFFFFGYPIHYLTSFPMNSQPIPMLVWGMASPCSESSSAADLSSCGYNQNTGQPQKYLHHTFTAWEVLISAVNWRQQLAKQ